MSVVAIVMGFSVTISKKFTNGFEAKLGFTGKDLIELIMVMSCLADTVVRRSRSRHNEHMSNFTMK